MCHTDYVKYVIDCNLKNVQPLDYNQWLNMFDDIY